MSESAKTASGASASRSRIARLSAKLSGLLCSESPTNYRRAAAVLLAFFLLLAIVQCILGAPPLAGPWDMVTLLDGGWRIINGQIPHQDFYNPNGSLTYELIAFGLRIGHPSTSSVTYGIVLLAAILIPLAWRIASTRLPWLIAAFAVLLTGAYLLSPRPPGYGIRETTYAMIYNREGYVLLSMLLVCLFLKVRDSIRQASWLDGVFAGFLLGLLLYCKITYFIAAVGLTIVAVILFPRAVSWFLAAAAAFAGVCLGFFVVFRISLYRYLLDIAAAGFAQSRSMRIHLLSEGIKHNVIGICVLFSCLALWTWAQSRPGSPRLPALRQWLAAASIVAAALMIVSGNGAQRGGIDDPLYFFAALVAIELFRRQNGRQLALPDTPVHMAMTTSAILVLAILSGGIVARDLASDAYTVEWDLAKRPALAASQRLHSATLSDFYVPPTTRHITAYWPARDYPAHINDGIDLLRKHLESGDRVTAFAFANPFSFALDIPPAHERPFWWDLNFSFDRTHYPPANQFLGDATLVIMPRLQDRSVGYSFETVDVMKDLYGGYLNDHFHEIDSTDTWLLYRRNPGH